ncbi:hypothetical protein [Phyllobacterium sp. K27]
MSTVHTKTPMTPGLTCEVPGIVTSLECVVALRRGLSEPLSKTMFAEQRMDLMNDHNQSTLNLRSVFDGNEDILVSIGRVTAIWGTISSLMRILLERYSDEPEVDLVKFHSMSGEGGRINYLTTILEPHRSNQWVELSIGALSKLKGIIGDRNIIVHGVPANILRNPHITDGPGLYFIDHRTTDEELKRKHAANFLAHHLPLVRKYGGELWHATHGWADDEFLKWPATT